MKCYRKHILFLTFTFLVTNLAHGQTKLFERFRFEDGGYSVVGIFSHNVDHPLQKRLGEFYTNDIGVLNALKRDWVFSEPQRDYACGYHYQILILKDGEEIDSFVINLECNQLRAAGTSLLFELEKLDTFSTKFKPLRHEDREFPSAKEAREYLNSIKAETDFVYAYPPRWLKYEGEFRFNLKCPPEIQDCFNFENFPKVEPKLQTDIEKAYPGELFELRAGGGSSDGDLFVIIKCDRSLEEKFVLYDRWNKEGFGKWEPYHPGLRTYWKDG